VVQIFLPLYDNVGRVFPKRSLSDSGMVWWNGGSLTAHTQSPAEWLWKTGRRVKRDDLVIFEVTIHYVGRKWWTEYRHWLEKRFKQKDLLVRVQDVRVL